MPDHSTRVLTCITELYGLEQLINEPSSITESSSTIIDIFKLIQLIKFCSGVHHVGISDHSLIYAFRKLSVWLLTYVKSKTSYRNFKNFSSESFRSDLCSQDWERIKAINNPNQMGEAWKCTFLQVLERYAPLRTKRIRNHNLPWITAEIKTRMRERDVLKIKAMRSGEPDDWNSFK